MNIFGQFFKLWKETIFIGVISEISFYRRPPWPFYILETPNFSLENPIFYLLTPNLRRGLPYFHWRPKAFFFINPPIIINKPWRDGDVCLRWKGVSNKIGGFQINFILLLTRPSFSSFYFTSKDEKLHFKISKLFHSSLKLFVKEKLNYAYMIKNLIQHKICFNSNEKSGAQKKRASPF